MKKPNLSRLAELLDRMSSPFGAIDIFADDLEELTGAAVSPFPATWTLDDAGPPLRFRVVINGETRHVQVFEREGIVRLLSKDETQWPEVLSHAAVGASVGAGVGAILDAATERKGQAWLPGLFLGLLVGAVVSATSNRRGTIAVQFDSAKNEWKLYRGGLFNWAHKNLNPGASA